MRLAVSQSIASRALIVSCALFTGSASSSQSGTDVDCEFAWADRFDGVEQHQKLSASRLGDNTQRGIPGMGKNIEQVDYRTSITTGPGETILFDDMEHNSPFSNGWFEFNGDGGYGRVFSQSKNLPPQDGGSYALTVGYGPDSPLDGFYGGFGRTSPRNLTDQFSFSFWINPDTIWQRYRLEFNLQEDDNGDGEITSGDDDEFQYDCEVSPTGPCAVSGGGWQKVTVPLSSFYDDNSYLNGGNGVLDANAAGNGGLINIVVAIISSAGTPATFSTDFWTFDGAPDSDADGVIDSQDNCVNEANGDQRDTDKDGFGNLCDADLNNDCAVNPADVAIMKSVFFATDEDADLDGNGAVNFLDLSMMKAGFFLPPGPSGLPTECDGS